MPSEGLIPHVTELEMKAQSLRDKLSQWEAHLAPLSAHQKDGYLELSTAATSRPLPTQVGRLPGNLLVPWYVSLE